MAYEVKLVKLINGDMVLAKWDEEKKQLKDPATLQMVPTQTGVQMMLLPFGYPFDSELTGEIDGKHILYEYKSVPEELKTKYLEASSNLTLSTPSDLKDLSNLAGPGGKITDLSGFLKK
ncbi:hypothetical protein SAMN04488516_102247 [Desulfonauticus submarinus]|uniref:Uncharacterized protein n=1 Tax=Desulfonauticus submarinus TaxID=206665 RepID=A0A1H0BPV1_9BACT|nr:hypothetical protein [Desulfonauticus submarinus]SDN47608.1 hypothetical protein SAMN04488516_102247 [Desulfonauticus submarinus]